jgi:hypothetical protein
MNVIGRVAHGIVITALLESCTPHVGIWGKTEGDRVVLSIFSCALPWHLLPVQEIVVYKEGARSQGLPPECKLSTLPDESNPLPRWAYGTAPEGFHLDACTPLVAGQRYEVSVWAVGFGDRRFALDGDRSMTWEPRHACR